MKQRQHRVYIQTEKVVLNINTQRKKKLTINFIYKCAAKSAIVVVYVLLGVSSCIAEDIHISCFCVNAKKTFLHNNSSAAAQEILLE